MKIVPFVHEGLGNSSYLIGVNSGGAILIDPDRTVQRYVDAAAARNWEISAVLETHLHADYVSGAHELAAAVGATLFVPGGEGLRLPHRGVRASEHWAIDGLEIESIASPGHTPEHLSYVIRSASHVPVLFSGGSLIVGGAARTDLIAPDMTDALTRAQHRTLRNAFKGLPGETELYPTHGGGSFCSTGSGSERTSTLGLERANNPAMNIESEDEFARWFPSTFPAAPRYFFRTRSFNRDGPRLRSEISMPRPLSVDDFDAARQDALVIDTRSVEEYSAAHLPGSLHIAFRDVFAVWLGWLVPPHTSLLFVAEPGRLDAIVDESLLVGYENLGGWLLGGIDAWRASGRAVASTEFVSPERARSLIVEGADVIDVRERNEFAQEHVPGARHVPLGDLETYRRAAADEQVVLYCGHGERASTGASLLERAGHTRIATLRGGPAGINESTEGGTS